MITLASSTYTAMPRLMIESLRVWHPDVPVTVYALDGDWSEAHARAFDGLSVSIKLLHERDRSDRGSSDAGPSIGSPLCARWKLDAMADQREPFLWLDGDMLVLRPLDPVFDAISRYGWVAVHEAISPDDYLWGELTQVIGTDAVSLCDRLKAEPLATSPNTGIIGASPDRLAAALSAAITWAQRLTTKYHGDQALLTIALALHAPDLLAVGNASPVGKGPLDRFNARLHRTGQIDLTSGVLHLTGLFWRKWGTTKAQAQQNLWNAWPRGARITALEETDFYRQSLPHPWPWPNQCNHRRHRAFIADLRRRSMALREQPGLNWLLLRDAFQAYLMDDALLDEIDAFWLAHAPGLKSLRPMPTYHLKADGTLCDLILRRDQRRRDEGASRMPPPPWRWFRD